MIAAIVALACAALPAGLFFLNLRRFHAPTTSSATPASVLIPARNEAGNIAGAIRAALGAGAAEVIVLDDHSEDETATITAGLVAGERVRLVRGQTLPAGWCGKNFACWQLGHAARFPVLLFVDADVRLQPGAVPLLVAGLERARRGLVSGIPRQELASFPEQFLIPLLHFILLGFLPFRGMQRSLSPRYGAACGQLLACRQEDYLAAGGHHAVRRRVHDAMALARQFRARGFATDLIDVTALASCRMYHNGREVWNGLAKNTHEGLGAPGRIVPFTLLLLGGQVLPFVLLGLAPFLSPGALALSVLAAALALAPRLFAAKRFHQPAAMALLHPFSIITLLVLQWLGLVRYLTGRPTSWKGRPSFSPRGSAESGDGVTPANA